MTDPFKILNLPTTDDKHNMTGPLTKETGIIAPNLQKKRKEKKRKRLNCSVWSSTLRWRKKGEVTSALHGITTLSPTSCLQQEDRTILDNFLEMLLSWLQLMAVGARNKLHCSQLCLKEMSKRVYYLNYSSLH